MVQETALQRIERALESKTRVAGEQLALEQGDLVDIWRKPATKDESGWRGPLESLNLLAVTQTLPRPQPQCDGRVVTCKLERRTT